jgi:hypothetical protein
VFVRLKDQGRCDARLETLVGATSAPNQASTARRCQSTPGQWSRVAPIARMPIGLARGAFTGAKSRRFLRAPVNEPS